jgi:hypothetical protein
MNLHYDTPHCKIYFLEEEEAVFLEWCGFALSNKFREACDFSLKLLEEKKLQKMLVDNTNGKALAPEDQKWLSENWFERAFQKGYRASAVVMSKDVFNKVAVKNIVNNIDGEKFTVAMFDNLAEAKKWIKKFKPE